MAGLEIRGLVVGYGRRPVAGPLDFDLDRASLNLICAPNGWGKTALLRTLAGLESPCSGRIAALPGPLSWVPQESKFDVDSPVRVDEFIRLHLDRSWKAARKRTAVREALELVGKPDILGRPCRQLSGGEKQSVLIARALAREPRSILLDEPLSALDRDRKRQLIETLAALVTKGVLVVLVSHEMPEMEIAVPLRTIELGGMAETAR